jgi:hypothetical protein
LEDFHHVIGESLKALNFTRSTLFKFKKEPVAPSEYDDPIATCRLNVRCLQEVLDTLDAEGLKLGQQEVVDVMENFRSLERCALEQKEAAIHLAAIVHQLQGTQASMADLTTRVDRRQYESPSELDAALKQLIVAKGQLQAVHLPQLRVLQEQLQKFAAGHSEVSVDKLQDDVSCADADLNDSLLMSGKRATELQSALSAWNSFEQGKSNVVTLVQEATDQLEALRVVIHSTSNREDLSNHLADILAMRSNFSLGEDSLSSLQRNLANIQGVCSDATIFQLTNSLRHLDSELSRVKIECQKLVDEAHVKMFTAQRPVVNSTTAYWRILRRVLPLALAATLFLTLLCIIDPSFPRRLVFSPKLRYVRGPPPV